MTGKQAVVSSELVQQFVGVGDTCELAEAEFTKQRMQGIRDRKDNPCGIEIGQFGAAIAFVATALPGMRMFNRVLNFKGEDVDRLKDVLQFYSVRGVTPEFEVAPHDHSSIAFEHLAEEGFRQADFHGAFVGNKLSGSVPSERVTVTVVNSSSEFDKFSETYLRAWEVDSRYSSAALANISFWRDRRDWCLYIARLDGQVAGVAILFKKGEVAYLANAAVIENFRRNGVHSQLIRSRLQEAFTLGCRTIFSHAAWNSYSHRNMLRNGLQLCYTKAIWRYQT